MRVLILNTPGSYKIETERLSKFLFKNLQITTECEQKSVPEVPTTELVFNPQHKNKVKLANGFEYYNKYAKGYDAIIINWTPKTQDYVSTTWYHPAGCYVLEVALWYADDSYRVTSHEFLHGFWWKVQHLGYQREDTLDWYDKEMEPDAPDGNRARNILALQKYKHLLDSQPSRIAKLQAKLDELKRLLSSLVSSNKLVTPSGLEGIKSTFGNPGDERNIVLFDLPYPLYFLGKKVTRARCHKKLVDVFKAVFRELQEKGYAKYVQNYGGIYNVRLQRTGAKMSTHSWGIAIDVETEKYPLGSKNRLPQGVIDIFTKHGFVYGGDFPTPDPQHFQYAKDY